MNLPILFSIDSKGNFSFLPNSIIFQCIYKYIFLFAYVSISHTLEKQFHDAKLPVLGISLYGKKVPDYQKPQAYLHMKETFLFWQTSSLSNKSVDQRNEIEIKPFICIHSKSFKFNIFSLLRIFYGLGCILIFSLTTLLSYPALVKTNLFLQPLLGIVKEQRVNSYWKTW